MEKYLCPKEHENTWNNQSFQVFDTCEDCGYKVFQTLASICN